MLRMMVITAHPDDEAGGFGGSLRLYSDRGVETCVLCLTPGQAATYRGGARNDQELAAIRRKEFAAIRFTDDAVEGITAFLEKRKPQFGGGAASSAGGARAR